MATDCDIETRKVRQSPHRGLLIIGVCYSVFLIDQISKWIILHVLVPGETIPVIPKLLSLTLAHNRGMAFGLLQGRTGFLSLISLIAAIVLPIVIERTLREGNRLLPATGLALILAGDLGNLLDRLLRKNGVVDFIDFHIGDFADPLWRWFPFNVADSAICIGVGLYILAAWRCERPVARQPREEQKMKYNVTFGSDFALDEFGFVRKGVVTVEGDGVTYSGNKKWSTMAHVCIFPLITAAFVVVFVVFGFGVLGGDILLSAVLALTVIHYFCASQGSLTFSRSTITEIRRNGRMIKFKAQHPETGKVKKTVFKVDMEQNAAALEMELSRR